MGDKNPKNTKKVSKHKREKKSSIAAARNATPDPLANFGSKRKSR
jgi:hypothetical protein